MTSQLLLALLLPLVLLVAAVAVVSANQGRLPDWLERLSRRDALLWNVGLGLVISLALARWLLGH